MDKKLVGEIDNKNTKVSNDLKVTSRLVIDKYEWNQHDTKKIMVFCPDYHNFLIDQTKAVKYLKEILDSMESSFQKEKNNEILAEENLFGVRFNIQDIEFYTDALNRGGSRIILSARRVYYSSEIADSPRHPKFIYLCIISAPSEVMSGI